MRLIKAAVALVFVWFVCFVESMICETSYGGPFTILMSFVFKSVCAGFAVGSSVLLGLLLLIPRINDLWRRIGYWSLLLSAISVMIMVFASNLGLRTVEPMSKYQMMPFGIWCGCLFGIAFPIANISVISSAMPSIKKKPNQSTQPLRAIDPRD